MLLILNSLVQELQKKMIKNSGKWDLKEFLVYGINRISKKNLQLNNHKNIDKIFEYIENYRKKNGELSWGLLEIKTFFSTKILI